MGVALRLTKTPPTQNLKRSLKKKVKVRNPLEKRVSVLRSLMPHRRASPKKRVTVKKKAMTIRDEVGGREVGGGSPNTTNAKSIKKHHQEILTTHETPETPETPAARQLPDATLPPATLDLPNPWPTPHIPQASLFL